MKKGKWKRKLSGMIAALVVLCSMSPSLAAAEELFSAEEWNAEEWSDEEFSIQKPMPNELFSEGHFSQNVIPDSQLNEITQEGAELQANYQYGLYQLVCVDSQGNPINNEDLTGIPFTLSGDNYNKTVMSDYARSEYRIYFGYLFSGSPKTYTLTIDSNAPYVFEGNSTSTTVISHYSSQLTPDDQIIRLQKKTLAENDTGLSIAEAKVEWNSGDGSVNTPYTNTIPAAFNPANKIVTAKAHHDQASVNGAGQKYITNLSQFGNFTIDYQVTAADGQTVSYYQLSISRTKNKGPSSPQDLKTVPPTSINGNDGKITGLNPNKTYEYSADNADPWIPVAQGAAEITGLFAGTYYVRLAETADTAASVGYQYIVAAPVIHSITLNSNITIRDISIPSSAATASKIVISIPREAGKLLKQVTLKKLFTSGSYIFEDILPNNFLYKENTVEASFQMPDNDVVIENISFYDGTYYPVNYDKSTESMLKCEPVFSPGENLVTQNGQLYAKAQSVITITASAKQPVDYKIASLTAGDAAQTDPDGADKMEITLTVTGEINVSIQFKAFYADLSEVEKIIEQIPPNLDDYTEDSRKALKVLLGYLALQPMKSQQSTVDAYADLLQEAIDKLVKILKEASVTLPPPEPGRNPAQAQAAPGEPVQVQSTAWNIKAAEVFQYQTPYTVTVTIKPADKNVFTAATVPLLNGARPNGTITLNNDGTITFTHQFPSVPYPVTYYRMKSSAGFGGTITPEGDVYLSYGSAQIYTVVPKEGYEILDVLEDGVSVGKVTEYKLICRGKEVSIQAKFARIIPDSYPEGSTANEDGTITLPNGTVVQPDGAVLLPDENNTVLKPDDSGNAPGIGPDGSVTDLNGVVFLPDGTIILPGKDRESKDDDITIAPGADGKWPLYDPEKVQVTAPKDSEVSLGTGTPIQVPQGTIITNNGDITGLDGTFYNFDGSIYDKDGNLLRPATPAALQENAMWYDRNKVFAGLQGPARGAQGYDFYLSKSPLLPDEALPFKINLNEEDALTSFYFVRKGLYYGYCRSWFRDADGIKHYSQWAKLGSVEVPHETPNASAIQKVTVKGNSVTIKYTKGARAEGFDAMLGRNLRVVDKELRPVNYGNNLKKNYHSTTVTFSNLKKGIYYFGVRAYITNAQGLKIFGRWSLQSEITKITIS